jgi:signal transduction histidine kinase
VTPFPADWLLGSAVLLLSFARPSAPGRLRPTAIPLLLVLAWLQSIWAWLGLAWMLAWDWQQQRPVPSSWIKSRLALLFTMVLSSFGMLPLAVLLDVLLGLLLGQGTLWVWAFSQGILALLLARSLDSPVGLALTLALLILHSLRVRPLQPAMLLPEMLQDNRLALEAASELRAVAQRTQQHSQLARQFLAQEDYLQTLQQALGLADQIVPSQCVAILLRDEQGRLCPLVQRSGLGDRLEACLLQGLREPVVEECWTHLQPVLRFQEAHPDRLFPVTGVALALPLADQGVLFLAGPYQPVDELQREQLVQLASVAGESMARADRQRHKTAALEEAQSAAHRLQSRLRLAEKLLQGVLSITESLESTRIQAAAVDAAQRLVDGSRVVLQRGSEVTTSASTRAPDAQLLAQLELRVGQGVILRNLDELQLGQLQAREILLAPLLEKGQRLGLLLAMSDRDGDFTADHLVMVKLIVASLGLAMENAGLHQSLVHTSKMLAVGQLAAGVAHEINNPLMAISMQAEVLQSFVQEPEVRTGLGRILEAVERCRQISYGLLSFARGGAVKLQSVCLAQAVERARRFVQLQSPVSVELDPHWAVMAGESELVQVLVNLLQNADQAMQEAGTAEPRIWVTATLGSDNQIALEVRDCGPGMQESVRQRIFEPFFTTREVGAGTGLGLYLVFNLVQSMSGRIEVETVPEQGSCLRIWLTRA